MLPVAHALAPSATGAGMALTSATATVADSAATAAASEPSDDAAAASSAVSDEIGLSAAQELVLAAEAKWWSETMAPEIRAALKRFAVEFSLGVDPSAVERRGPRTGEVIGLSFKALVRVRSAATRVVSRVMSNTARGPYDVPAVAAQAGGLQSPATTAMLVKRKRAGRSSVTLRRASVAPLTAAATGGLEPEVLGSAFGGLVVVLIMQPYHCIDVFKPSPVGPVLSSFARQHSGPDSLTHSLSAAATAQTALAAQAIAFAQQT